MNTFLLILLIIFGLLLYMCITAGLCFGCIGIHNPIHKFQIEEDIDGNKSIIIETVDDKFSFFSLCIIWPLLVVFYWIPIGIYKVLKFLIEFIGWCIAKIFKL